MTATLIITLSDEVLKALKAAKDITVALEPGGRPAPASRAAPTSRAKATRRGRKRKAARSPKAAKADSGPYRAGSLPAKLLLWAGGLKKPFGVPDLMKKFKIKRGHASMLIAYVTKGGAVERVGRGEYAAA